MPKHPVTDPICRSSITDQETASARLDRSRDQVRDQIRDQILDRLWQLANLNAEQTRGSIAGQIKAMSMILAIEGLIPGQRRAPAPAQPAAPPAPAQAPERPSPLRPDEPEDRSWIPAVYDANLKPAGPLSLAMPTLGAPLFARTLNR